jgi:hypothetical protein
MSSQQTFTEIDRIGIALGFLEEIRATGQTKPKALTIAIAHGLAYDPQVDGRLRLTPVGRAKLAAAREPA